MSSLLFKLNNVPEDEAADVRELLQNHHLEFYETSAGNWGISLAAIWLKDEDRLDEAKAILDEYQQQRAANAQQAFSELKASGEHRTFWQECREQPVRLIGYLIIIFFIFYLTIRLLLDLA